VLLPYVLHDKKKIHFSLLLSLKLRLPQLV